MTTRLMPRRGLLAAALFVVPIAGCSLLPDPPEPKIYRLDAEVDDPPGGSLLHSQLIVDRPTASQSLDTDRIALVRGRTEFEYYADSTWTDRVPVLLQNLLVAAFESDGRIANVVRQPDSLGSGYLLETDIREFEARYAGSAGDPPVAVVSFTLRLTKMQDRQMIGHLMITEQTPAARNKLDSVVGAFDDATGKALEQSVSWALRTIAQS